MPDNTSLGQLSINTIRTLAMDAVEKAQSGHPGTPMALAPVAYMLWQRFLRYDPGDPIWPNRDRFVLSAGHASMLLYGLLHLTGAKAVDPDYEVLGEPAVSMDDISFVIAILLNFPVRSAFVFQGIQGRDCGTAESPRRKHDGP